MSALDKIRIVAETADNEFQDRDKLPRDWAPKELEDHVPLVCFRCGEEVSFE